MADFSIRAGFAETDLARAAVLYWDAFKGKLGKIMGPDERACGFFATTMNAEYALSAVDQSGELLGIAGFKTNKGSLTGGSLRDMTRVYGWVGGTWRGLLLSALERDVQPGILLMDGICVGAAARGKGVGTALLSAIKSHARQSGLSTVRLDVIDSNAGARALYEREGFAAIGTTHTGSLRHIFGFRQATAMQCDVS
ncbi:GNAT family N-acetyltransferase [Roseovarius aestuarii]|uniref:Mycothiol acetyltransferase n=1 Tax=Roseovarius aestuarii TaxID=475083 RepID=A0A1X7BRM3_9RHOB|nr:GNAT family N-acetyltransferase [Roseovarius aestuarii]SMC12292.1 Mycothiol acetyltransferase [Roseovarius aestuarii]